MKNRDYIQFDLTSYLQEKGIEYSEEGKNVTSGWTEVNCPFCGDDPSMHLGISPERLLNCWRCGAKGNIIKYIKAVEDCSWHEAEKIAKKYVDESLEHLRSDIIQRSVSSGKGTILPESIKGLSDIHYEYLENRGFNPVEIEKKYKIKAMGRAKYIEDKKFEYRIIIPMIQNNIIVNFTARDFSGKRFPKYVNCQNENSAIPIKNLLYNIDSVRDIALVVEGATDVWKIGDGAVAVMGMEFTMSQINLLLQKKIKKAFIMFDAEERAQKQAKKIAKILSGFIPTAIIYLDHGDPGDLSQKEVNDITHEVGLR